MTRLRRYIAAAVVLASLVASASADAHQNPAGCNTGAANARLGGPDISGIHRNGDVISVIPSVSNESAANECDVTDATITVQFPAADGSGDGPSQVVATGIDLPAGTPTMTFPAVQHTLNFDSGVFRGPVTIRLSGIFHFVGTHSTPGNLGGQEANVAITRPHASVTVTPTPPMGDPPLGVTYSYAVTNDSPHDPEPGAADPSLNTVALTDDTCSPIPAAHTGDTNGNDAIDRGETWTYTCSTTVSQTTTNHVTMTGVSGRDGRPWPTATGESTVTINQPDMTLTKSHAGDFTQGDTGRTYSLVARNSGGRTSTGPVSVADTLPQGLTATAISGEGWSCTLSMLTCTRSDALAPGASYPPITVTVDVAPDAATSVINTAAVSRAGENTANDGASDPTTIAPPAPEKPADGSTGEQAGGGSQSGGDQTGGDTPPRDVTAPAFSALRVTNRTFAVAGKAVVAARARKGTAFVYRLSEQARVVFTIERKKVGRRVRFVRLGSFSRVSAAGRNTRRWLGTVGSRALAPGAYRASITATDAAGNESAPRRVSFRVVRR